MAGGETHDPGAGWLTPTPELWGYPAGAASLQRAGIYIATAPRAFSLTLALIPTS